MLLRRVEQRFFEQGDCGIACVAMVVDQPYDRVHDRAVRLGLRSQKGDYFTRHVHLRRLLKSFGVGVTLRRFRAMRQVVPNSIVAVHPREDGKYWHWVVVTGGSRGPVLLDPKPKKPERIELFSGYNGVGMYLHCA